MITAKPLSACALERENPLRLNVPVLPDSCKVVVAHEGFSAKPRFPNRRLLSRTPSLPSTSVSYKSTDAGALVMPVTGGAPPANSFTTKRLTDPGSQANAPPTTGASTPLGDTILGTRVTAGYSSPRYPAIPPSALSRARPHVMSQRARDRVCAMHASLFPLSPHRLVPRQGSEHNALCQATACCPDLALSSSRSIQKSGECSNSLESLQSQAKYCLTSRECWRTLDGPNTRTAYCPSGQLFTVWKNKLALYNLTTRVDNWLVLRVAGFALPT